MNKHYDMASLIGKIDEPYLKVDSLGNPRFYFEEELDTISLVDQLRCGSTSLYFKDTLGVLDINVSESREILLQVTDFYRGEPGHVPPCSATIVQDLDTFSTYSQVTVKEAYAAVTVSNHLGLALTLVQIKLIDQVLQDTLQTVTFSHEIEDGGSVNQDIILSEKTFSNRLSMQVKGVSPGGIIQILEGKYLTVDFSLDSMKVVGGKAQLPSYELFQEEKISLPTKSIIDSAGIRSGNLTLHLRNHTNLGADVEIDFPELEKDGVILTTACYLPASGYSDPAFVLDGYMLKPEKGNETMVQTRVNSPGSGETLIDYNSSDSVVVQASLSEIIFSQVSGIIESTWVAIDPMERTLEIPPGFESAHLTSAGLSLEIYNGVNLPADLSMSIQGNNGQYFNLRTEIDASGPFGTAVTSLYEDQLESLLNPVPRSLTITGEIIYGDGQTFGIAREEDSFFGIMKVSSPLELILDSCQVQIDADSDQVEDDVREMIEDQINFGKVILKVENHLPLAGKAKIFVSRNQESLFLNPDMTIGPVDVPSGELSYDGSVKQSKFSETETSLTYQEFQVFTNSPFYLAGQIDFPGTGKGSVKALSTDFIRITSHLELNVKNRKD